MTIEIRLIWTTGRQACVASVQIAISDNYVIAWGDRERLTPNMMKRALNKEFPRHTFIMQRAERDDDIRASADHWTGDGIN